MLGFVPINVVEDITDEGRLENMFTETGETSRRRPQRS